LDTTRAPQVYATDGAKYMVEIRVEGKFLENS